MIPLSIFILNASIINVARCLKPSQRCLANLLVQLILSISEPPTTDSSFATLTFY